MSSKPELPEQPATSPGDLRLKLYRYCLSLTRMAQDAEDLVQDTLLKAEARSQRRGSHANEEALMLRMAKNAWIDGVRRSLMYKNLMLQERRQGKERVWEGADRRRERMAAAFYVLLRDLSPLQRQVLLMREVLGYSAAESADMLETTEGSVKSLLHRARRALTSAKLSGVEAQEEACSQLDGNETAIIEDMVEAYVQGNIERLLWLAATGEFEVHTVVEAVSEYRTALSGSSATYGAWSSMEMRLVA